MSKNVYYRGILLLLLSSISLLSFSQNVKRPPIYGIAKMTYYISSFDLAKTYYGDFLGFYKAFSYRSEKGQVESYKINDRQFLEFVENKNASGMDRLISVSFETDNVVQMQAYLLSKGVKLIKDLYGVTVEFIEYTHGSLHSKSKSEYLSDRRISTRMHHVGLFTKTMDDNAPFYTDILDFKRILRFPLNEDEAPRILYFRLPESAEMIEHYPSDDRNFNHPCFVTMDIQETVSILRERKKDESLGVPSIGMGKRWLLNLNTQDGTKVEFTEPYISVF